ncbi:FtsX-like permease family protein [Saccharopolyspora gregorii]|uniref:ABC transporter permease n=1 Tax=Saccharopolyspora gregorii TaxID=33914 RepID=A0ABP6RTI9_9PSEU
MSRIRSWIADLVLGIRLAVGDRNTPWGRLALMTVGVGIGVLVLLASAALPNWAEAKDQRAAARDLADAESDRWGIPAAVLGVDGRTTFHEHAISGVLLEPRGPDAPLPAGLDHYPAAGELIVSPALADLLARPDSALLRERLPGTVTGTIGDDGLLTPGELHYYGGATGLTEWNADYRVDDHFGETYDDKPTSTPDLLLLWAMGACALLLPVVVFVISTTRLAEAARQRRLAALRLVGASAWQVRRIASGETLVGATTGVLAGWGLFGAAHLALSRFETSSGAVFVADLTPMWWPAAAVTLGVPAATVLISLVALRGAVHDPLRSVRQATPIRRRLWPRCVPLVVGVLGVATARLQSWSTDWWMAWLVVSIVLILLSVPLLLPWGVASLAERVRGGPVAWQLALRRLHLTSGTAARSVSAIAVVVTGVIALQTMLAASEANYAQRGTGAADAHSVYVYADEDPAGRPAMSATAAEITAMPGVRSVTAMHEANAASGADSLLISIADCATITRFVPVGECRDGDVFLPEHSDDVDVRAQEGRPWRIATPHSNAAGTGPETVDWPVPPGRLVGRGTAEFNGYDLVLTPAAATAVPMEARTAVMSVDLEADAPPDLVEHIRNAAAANLRKPTVGAANWTGVEESLAAIRLLEQGLLAGALVVFSLIGCSLLVTAAEQIHERARPMAVLGAVGAKRSTLVWSAFLQNAVPMLLALVPAVPIGYATGTLALASQSELLIAPDLPGMAAVLAFAAVSVLVVTALTAPALSKAMSPDGLHTE